MKILTNILVLIVITLFTVNTSNAQITSDFDKDIDFSIYKTYSFAGWAYKSDEILDKPDKDLIINSLREEFTNVGLTYKESAADVKITLYIVVLNGEESATYTAYNTNMGYNSYFGWGAPDYNYHTQNVGTFAVSMFDEKTKNKVWQGVITTVVKDKPAKRKKSIPKKIKQLMEGYPLNIKK